MRTATALLLTLSLPAAVQAAERIQAPDAPWKTYRTAHYRIHFPARGDFEPFAREVASKIEGIHEQVVSWVGYASPVPVDVVLRDPVLEANGMAVPLLEHPFVVLWKTEPDPESGIGHVTTWAELVVTHELAHVHHLMRPQNQPTWRDKLLDLPISPLTLKAPRWVIEGYATLIEGKITGKGRPHGAYRAAVIRQWALEGKLPDYGSLSGTRGFRGGSMAYLVGSAYLEWLEARNPKDPDLLKKFWKQIVSKKRRSFEASFTATFGMGAQEGYDRWRAEVVHDALELERRMKGQLREGEPWAKLDGEMTDLAVSPDGKRLLARVLTEKFKGLAVWDLAAKDGHGKPTKKKRPAESKADPNEVEDRPPAVPAREPTWKLSRVQGALPRRAAWSGESVVLEYRLPDSEGTLHPHFAAWTPGSAPRPGITSLPRTPQGFTSKVVDGIWNIASAEGKVLTRTLSAARNPAPSPDGKFLYFTRLRASGMEIRKLDLGLPPLQEAALPKDPDPLAPATILPPADEASRIPAAVPAPEPAPYRAWRGLWNGARFGISESPSGHSWQVGYGGGDILGQASWQVLGAAGEAAGPRGGAAGLAWRGWRWAPSLEVFSSLERPSRQSWVQPKGLDRERRGAELAFTFEDKGTWPHSLRLALATERATSLDDPGQDLDRSLAGLEAALAPVWRPAGMWAFRASTSLRVVLSRAGSQTSTLQRAQLALSVVPPAAFPPLAVRLETGRIGGGNSTPLTGFQLGGLATSLVPSSLDAQRIEQAALPAFTATGNRLRRGRVELGRIGRVYLEHTAVWDEARPRPHFQRIAGIEFVLDDLLEGNSLDSLMGRMRFSLGFHRLLDDGPEGAKLRGRHTFTASVVLKP
jgi:hypothetical protein